MKVLKEEPHDWYKDMQAGTITHADYKQMVKEWEAEQARYSSGPRYSRKTSYVGQDANATQISAVEALNPKPNTFLGSILQQLKNGRGLSGKQKAVVRKIMAKRDPGSVALFEGKIMKITKRQLRRIIKEALDGTTDGTSDPYTPEQAMYIGITDTLAASPGMGGVELVDTVNQMHPSIGAELIWNMLDTLQEDGEVFFNVEEDEWWLSSDYELQSAEGGTWSDERDYETGFYR